MGCDNYCGRNHLLRKTVATSNRIQRKTDRVGVVVQESLLYLCHLQLYLAGRLQVSSDPAPSQGAQILHPPYLQGNVIDLHVVGAPLPEELDVRGFCYCRCSCFPLRHPRDKNHQSPGICITNSEASLEHNLRTGKLLATKERWEYLGPPCLILEKTLCQQATPLSHPGTLRPRADRHPLNSCRPTEGWANALSPNALTLHPLEFKPQPCSSRDLRTYRSKTLLWTQLLHQHSVRVVVYQYKS